MAEKISIKDGVLNVPDNPVIPFIEGDGTGPDIWAASVRVFDAAVEKAYGGKRKVEWQEVLAGQKAFDTTGSWLPDETVDAFREYHIGIKGPLTTPVGGGIRSINVALRQILDLYVCLRPVKYFNGVPSPVKAPELIDMVIFRENTEDIYAGIEFKEGDAETADFVNYLKDNYPEKYAKVRFPDTAGFGIKPVSAEGTKRLVKSAIDYAIQNKRDSVTLVHKGNIMKFTEGAFRDWGYQLAEEEFAAKTISEEKLWDEHDGKVPSGKIVIKDRIADSMFQQVLTRPDEYSVLATTNLNGDYLSDACAAQVGGLGIAPGANIGDNCAIFEATHGTAPKYADKDVINPGSVILSGALMFEYLGWTEATNLIHDAFGKTIQQKVVTYDLERLMDGAKKVKTSEFADQIIKNMG